MAVKQIDYYGKNFRINYEIINNKSEDWIVFLHGWGSNKNIMKQAFGKELEGMNHLYIDMPGFGKSDNNYILTTKDYANIMQLFLENALSLRLDNLIIAGHSFGGKVATYLKPKLLVLLSSAGILEEKSLKTLLTIRMAKVFNRFGLAKVNKMLRSKDVENMDSNMYETFKNVVDEDFSEVFSSYEGKALLFWGEKDTATTLESGKKIHQLIKESEFQSYDGDHYFFIHFTKDICDIIESNNKKDKS